MWETAGMGKALGWPLKVGSTLLQCNKRLALPSFANLPPRANLNRAQANPEARYGAIASRR